MMQKEYVWEYKGQLVHLYGHEIFYVHLERRNTYVHTRDKSYLIGTRIQDEVERLKDMPVIRTHYSYLLNPRYLESIRGNSAVMCNGVQIPVSTSRKKEAVESIREYLYQKKKCKKFE